MLPSLLRLPSPLTRSFTLLRRVGSLTSLVLWIFLGLTAENSHAYNRIGDNAVGSSYWMSQTDWYLSTWTIESQNTGDTPDHMSNDGQNEGTDSMERLPIYYIQKKPRIVQPPQSESVIAGQSVIFHCIVEGNPSPHVRWTISGVSVLVSRFGEEFSMPRGSVLRISNVLPTLHNALVACLAENALGHAEASARLSIYQNEEAAPSGFPRFLNVFSVIVAKKNEKVELECQTHGDPPPTVRWYKDSLPVDLTSPRFVKNALGGLEISRLVEEDEGMYECAATNTHGTRLSPGESLMVRDDIEATLQLLAPKTKRFRPHFTSVPAPVQVMGPGGRISLSCTAVGAPVPTVTWYRGHEQLFTYMLDRQPPGTARLALFNVTESVNVTCIASSPMGQIKHDVAIIVKELPPTPGLPRFLSQKRIGEVMIAFSRPASNRLQAPVSKFLVQWMETKNFLVDYLITISPEIAAAIQPNNGLFTSGQEVPIERGDSNQVGLQYLTLSAKKETVNYEIACRLVGLKPYTNYTVWVRSVSPNGDVSASTPPVHFATEPELPTSPPTRIQASAISNAAVSVSWDQPVEANGPITMYRVYYTDQPKLPLANWQVKLLSVDHALGSPSPYEAPTADTDAYRPPSHLTLITHLQSNATYYIRISASNAKGDGPPSAPYPVIVRPGVLPPPVNLQAVSKSAHEISLTWQMPESKPDQPLLVKYELTSTAFDTAAQTSTSHQTFLEPSSSSHLVSGLLPDTRYRFRLAAVSEAGAGLPAEVNAKTKEYVPGPPRKILIKAIGSNTLSISWAPPVDPISTASSLTPSQSNDLRNVYYSIDLQPTDSKGTWLAASESTPNILPVRQQVAAEQAIENAKGQKSYTREISNLHPNTYYMVSVRAVTRSGSGDRAKSAPEMTWPLPPGKPTDLKLRTTAGSSGVSQAGRLLVVTWSPPVATTTSGSETNAGDDWLHYSIQWNLLIQRRHENLADEVTMPPRRRRRQFSLMDEYQGPKESAETTGLEVVTPAMGKRLGIPLQYVSGQENTTKLTWEPPAGVMFGGLSYEIRVAAFDQFQTGEEVLGRVELPDNVPSLPPSGLRIDTTAPSLLFHWKAPPLEARNGRLRTYEVECAWVDMAAGLKDWELKRLNSSNADGRGDPRGTLFWPSGEVSLLNLSSEEKTEGSPAKKTAPTISFGTVYRVRVRAWTPAGPGPWSDWETLSLKELVPAKPTIVEAVNLGNSGGTRITWALPEKLVQTSLDRRRPPRPILYRHFSVEYATSEGPGDPRASDWQRVDTAGPVSSLSLYNLNDSISHLVRVRSIGLANLHSDWSNVVAVKKAQAPETTMVTIGGLKCQLVGQTPPDHSAKTTELELSWNPVSVPAGVQLVHYLVNYTGNSIFLDANGHRIRRLQSPREQSVRGLDSSSADLVKHRLVGLQLNTVYNIDITPIFRTERNSVVVPVCGLPKSVFCRTQAEPPDFVPAPDFLFKPRAMDSVLTLYRASEETGSIAAYEIVVRDAINADAEDAETQSILLARFPAVTLFPPLRKAVRIFLNSTENTQPAGQEVFSAPSLIPGREYEIAVRACVEEPETAPAPGIWRLEATASSACTASEWTRSTKPYAGVQSKMPPPQIELPDDQLWPPFFSENLTNSPTQTTFNDAVPTAPYTRKHSSPAAPIVNSKELPWQASKPEASKKLSEENQSLSMPKLKFLVVGLSITAFICVLGFICIILVVYHRRNRGGVRSQIRTSKPPRSIAQSASNMANGYSILTHPAPDTPTQKQADLLSLRSNCCTFNEGSNGFATPLDPQYRDKYATTISSPVHRNFSGRSTLGSAACSAGSLNFPTNLGSTNEMTGQSLFQDPRNESSGICTVDALGYPDQTRMFGGGRAGGGPLRQMSPIDEPSVGGNCLCSDVGRSVAPILRPPPPYYLPPIEPTAPNSLIGTSMSSALATPLRYPSHSIPVEKMIDHVNLLKKDSGRLMAAEFESIDPGGQFTWEVSSRPENRSKNRYANVVAYDHSRIVLQKIDGVPDSDYINANYLDGYHRKNMYIATQGPLPNTIADFWRMVWEQRSSIIVAMTRLEERTRIKCEQYWPAIGHGTRTPMSSAVEGWSNHPQSPTTSTHFSPPHLLQDNPITPHRPSNSLAPLCQAPLATVTHGQITVGLLDVVELAYYTIRTFSLQKAGSQEKREVRQLQFTAWPDHGVPNHPAPLLMFLRRVNSECAPETGPIIVHCSAGVGRTGAYIVLDILLQQMRREHAINVPAAVARLRSQRNFMVQTEDQYAFIYEALVEASLSGNTELPARQLRDHWLKLTAPTGDTVSAADTLENTGMTLEFEQLISQTITSLANTIAHRSPGGLLSYLDRRSASVNQSTSGSFLDPSIAGSSVTELAGAQPVNLLKNRRSDCLPHEANRVKLTPIRGVDGSDYINASYVDSYSSRSAFIATQTPLPECLDDFWRMVWETGSCIIVQLDRRSEDTVPDAPYWPTEEAIRFDYVVVEPVADYGMPAYILRELRITDTRSGQSRTVRLFDASELAGAIARTLDSAQRQPLSSDQWEADGRPTLPPALPPLADWLPLKSAVLKPDFLSGYTRSSSVDNYKNTIFDGHLCQVASRNMIDLIEEVHKTQEQFGLEGPITVHCRYGTGYTGIFLALSIILERMRYEGVADMFQTIKLLWWQRRGLVEFPAEYAFCYATALEYLNFFEQTTP